MGYVCITPVEEGDASVFEQNVAIVEVAVIERFGYPVARPRSAQI
jgi:hypothetical protein